MVSRIPIVKLQIERGGIPATWYAATNHVQSVYTVVDEVDTFIERAYATDDYLTLQGKTSIIGRTTDWTEPNTGIKVGSVVVKDSTGTITYREGSTYDYTIDYTNAEIIRTDTSMIDHLATVKVSYSWYQPCISPETGNANKDCPQCNGKGVTYDDGTDVIGLLHIPKYESPLTKIGYFEMGDAIFTTTSLYKIKAKGYGDDHFYVRDLIVINDGTANQIWRVLSKPETIQIAGEYLAHKVHIRKIKEDEQLSTFVTGVTTPNA